MSIIYSYPEQGQLNADDMFIGTSAVTVGGKQKNITRNFTVQQIADFINQGTGFVDPLASDFQIPVFNQQGKKITGSIMSQNIYPNGSAITIAGSLTVNTDLTASGNVTLGSGANNIVLQSVTTLGGPVKDSSNTLGVSNQILISNSLGNLVWQNYEAGLTYEGTWDANTNTPTLTSGQGVSGHFYIVNVAGNTNLDGNNDWHVGDWAVFFDAGGGGTAGWQKIDNTSVLTGSGTANTFAMWTATETLNDSILTQDAGGTKIQVDGGIDTSGVIQSSVTNANLKIQGNGSGAVEIMSADGVTDARIQLNCSQNSHGVSIQSPPHAAGATYNLILPTTTGTVGQVLTTQGGVNPQLTWTTPSQNVIQALAGPLTSGFIPIATGSYTVEDSVISYAGNIISIGGNLSTQGLEVSKYLTDGTGSSGTDGQVLTSTTSAGDKETLWVDSSTIGDTYDLGSGASGVANSIELQLTSGSGTDNSAITLTGGTGITVAQAGDVVTLTGVAQGVTSVSTGDANTITVAGTATAPTIAANTSAVTLGSNNLATGDQIQTAINNAVAGSLTFKGTFDANTGAITSGVNQGSQLYTGATGGVAINTGDYYIADTSGLFFGSQSLQVGDEAIALNTVGAGLSTASDFSVVPSAAAGVTSVSLGTPATSTGSGLTINPTTGSVIVTPNSYAGGSNVGFVPSGGSAGKYLDGASGAWLNLPSGYTSWTASSDENTNITISDGTNLPFSGRLASDGSYSGLTGESGIYTDTSITTGEVTIGLINNGGTPSSNTFYRGDGQWAEPGGGASNIVANSFTTVNSTTQLFDLNAEPSGGSATFVDVFIDGVYQETNSYSVTNSTGGATGTLDHIQLTTAAPSGVTVETKTTTGVSAAGSVTSVSIGQTSDTGAVNLRIVPNYVTANVALAQANSLYIFDSTTTAYTVTLPASPTLGDSIKISNRGGLATNVLGANGNSIMGTAADLTIDNTAAAFEIIWAGGSQGWVIIGNV